MKYHETHFEEYLIENSRENLHPKLEKIYKKFPENIKQLKNIIFYGPNGVGKYTQMLRSIKQYSPSELKYEKKLIVTYDKKQYFFKISDIHYEIDISLLGCNSKLLWHEIYSQIIDIISAKAEKSGIIVCKYFHEIHSELLDNFYSYMQQNTSINIDLKYILITKELSFIPVSILNCCEVINVPRPTKNAYEKCFKKLPSKIKIENIQNIKMLNNYNEELMLPHKILCNKIIANLININDIQFLKFRDLLYDSFIYNLDIQECIWYILSNLIKNEHIPSSKISDVMKNTYCFLQYYNNNYRPIYHLEGYLFYLSMIIHRFEK